MSSTPLLGRVDNTFVAAEELVDVFDAIGLPSLDSILTVFPLDPVVKDAFATGVLSAAAAKAAVCCRADLLSLALVKVSWFVLFLFPCSLEPSSNADFLVLLGLGDALEAGLDPFDELLLPALLLALFPTVWPFVKLQIEYPFKKMCAKIHTIVFDNFDCLI